jgi:hypothetical protein
VFWVGVNQPEVVSEDAGTGTTTDENSTTEENTSTATVSVPTTPYVNPDSLVVLALVAGFAGPVVLRAARARLTDTIKVANLASVSNEKVDEVATKAVEEVETQPEAIREKVLEKVQELRRLPRDPVKAAPIVADIAEAAAQEVARQGAARIQNSRQNAMRAIRETTGWAGGSGRSAGGDGY